MPIKSELGFNILEDSLNTRGACIPIFLPTHTPLCADVALSPCPKVSPDSMPYFYT